MSVTALIRSRLCGTTGWSLAKRTVAATLATLAAGTIAITTAATGMSAVADQGYPSWGDIQQAQQNEASKQAEVDRLNALLTTLQANVDSASQKAGQAGQDYLNAKSNLDDAASREQQITGQASAAEAVAQRSKMRAGLIAASMARQGGGNLTLDLLFSSGDPEQLLTALGTASQFGQSAAGVYRQALADQRTAQALTDQAHVATAERQRLATLAQAASDAAQAAAQAADAALAEQSAHADELYAQLAALQNTTAELERERAAGILAQQQQEAAAAAAARLRNSSNSGASSSNGGAPAGPVDSSAVETAIAFAQAQIGDPYDLGAAGPDSWDCSGLTLMAYRAAGINIGTHSATNQYNTLASRGLAVSLGNIQRGDLLFWGSGGDYYHVAIYLGGGQILEAPDYGKPVRVYFIWGSPSAAARPAG